MKPTTHKLIQTLAFAAVFAAITTTAKSEVYKCTGADGKTAFSDQPCASGQKAAVIKPQTSSAPAARA